MNCRTKLAQDTEWVELNCNEMNRLMDFNSFHFCRFKHTFIVFKRYCLGSTESSNDTVFSTTTQDACDIWSIVC